MGEWKCMLQNEIPSYELPFTIQKLNICGNLLYSAMVYLKQNATFVKLLKGEVTERPKVAVC
jgi:hypothetical protein